MHPLHLGPQRHRLPPRALVGGGAPAIQHAGACSQPGPRAHGDEIAQRGEDVAYVGDGLRDGGGLVLARAVAAGDEEDVDGGRRGGEGVGGEKALGEVGGGLGGDGVEGVREEVEGHGVREGEEVEGV